MIPMVKLITLMILMYLAVELGATVPVVEESIELLPYLLQAARYWMAVFFLSLFVYLSVVRAPDGTRIPMRYRATLLVLAFFIFDLAREGSVLPGLSRDLTALAIYAGVTLMFWWGMHDVSRLHEIPLPREGVPSLASELRQDAREVREDLRRLFR